MLIDAVVRELGTKRSLREASAGREKFEELAVNSLKDFLLGTNPVLIGEKERCWRFWRCVLEN